MNIKQEISIGEEFVREDSSNTIYIDEYAASTGPAESVETGEILEVCSTASGDETQPETPGSSATVYPLDLDDDTGYV